MKALTFLINIRNVWKAFNIMIKDNKLIYVDFNRKIHVVVILHDLRQYIITPAQAHTHITEVLYFNWITALCFIICFIVCHIIIWFGKNAINWNLPVRRKSYQNQNCQFSVRFIDQYYVWQWIWVLQEAWWAECKFRLKWNALQQLNVVKGSGEE